MSDKILTAKQIAERYGVAASTARAWCLNGTLPGASLKETELGSFWVVLESKLANFVPPKPGPKPKAKVEATNGQATPPTAPTKKGAEERRRRNKVVDGLLSDRKAAQDSEKAKKGAKK